ncbi:hypothetical protein Rs2_40569 [Raphanus sativus]|nr:hypothetical protein Rs2_40569 [Raphanus sativus]
MSLTRSCYSVQGNVNNGGISDISSSYWPLDHQMEATVKLHTAYDKDFENVGYHACETRKIWVMRPMSMWMDSGNNFFSRLQEMNDGSIFTKHAVCYHLPAL